ncbi:MAG: nucleotidyl transferase AbiEii/AbiGii toxin family protein [Bacteroidota bacterium]
MIPRSDITAWSEFAPWKSNEQVEQDLIISRALVDLFSDDLLSKNLAFRGGTALHKLFILPQARYSEDIDLVQLKPLPIGKVLDKVKKRLEYMGKPRIKQHKRNNTMVFRFESEIPPVAKLKLKIEINCREHFVIYGIVKKPFEIKSKWFSGACEITTYSFEELLGSKIRALYQRKKGRDLFDLWYGLSREKFDVDKAIQAFKAFMEKEKHSVSSKEYENNLNKKINDAYFRGDIEGLVRTDIEFDFREACQLVLEKIIRKI